VGAFAAGKLAKEDYEGIERNAVSRASAPCGGMFTAQHDVVVVRGARLSLLGSSQMASPDARKADSAAESRAVPGRGGSSAT
jgi:dihydroxy-acid dehydratase